MLYKGIAWPSYELFGIAFAIGYKYPFIIKMPF